MTLIVLDEAELEFLEAVNYYEEAAGLGAQFRDEISVGVAWILENPRVLRLRPGNYYRLNLVACVKFSKKKSEKMCRIRFGFFEKRTIAFRLRLALPLPPNRLGTDSAPNLIGLLSRTFKNDCWWFMPQPIPSRATGSFSVRPALPY